jgi:hypothetical protein
MSCDVAQRHPYVPYKLRHPYDGGIALTTTCSILAFSLALFLTKRPRHMN